MKEFICIIKLGHENINRILTEKPHIAASTQDDKLAALFEDRLNDAGFDWVKKVPYNVLLSKPGNELNYVSLSISEFELILTVNFIKL